MESLQTELARVDVVDTQSQLAAPSELGSLQLALVGGGIGDTQL